MEYFLIILVIAVALAPLTHFMPSKRQRKIAGLREYAAVHGMFVEFRNLPGVDSDPARAAGVPKGTIIYYGKRLPPPRRGGSRAGSWLTGKDGWRSFGQRQAVPEPLLALSAHVLAASVDESSCGVYWQEGGTQEQVEQIRATLEAWSGELRQ